MTKGIRSLVLSAAPAVMFFAVSAAWADPSDPNRLLRGDYASSGETTCLYSAGGFDPDFTPVNVGPFPFVVSFSSHGVVTFNGDGSGKTTSRSVSSSHPYALPNPTPPHFFSRGGAGSSDLQSDFTYQVAPDRTFTISTPLVTGTVLTGIRFGQTFTFGPTGSAGRISDDRKTLTTASDTPIIETLTWSNGDVFQRICRLSRTLVKMKSD